MQKIYDDPEIGEVLLVKSTRAKRLSIKVHPTKGVRMTIPYYVPYSQAVLLFQQKRDWVLETYQKVRQTYAQGSDPLPQNEFEEIVEEYRQKAKETLVPRLRMLAQRYGFTVNKVTIKHNASNWGSCSSKGNINLNLNLVRVPQVSADYVLLHELCHLKYRNHGEDFHRLLENLCCQHILWMIQEEKSQDATTVALMAKKSHAAFPVQHAMEKGLKNVRII
ncbi:MAG: M48 family metallopeptidase [Bacteroidales bacterium]|nr:M48 family metallopeptidase [Bacteroidales bacterium]